MNGELRVSRALLQMLIDADDAATLALILSHAVRGQVSVRDICALARGPAQHKLNARTVLLEYGETLLAAAAAANDDDDVTAVAPAQPETRRRRLDGTSVATPLPDAFDAMLRATFAVDLSGHTLSLDTIYSLWMTLTQARGQTDRPIGKDAFGSRVCDVFNLDPRTPAFKLPLRQL